MIQSVPGPNLSAGRSMAILEQVDQAPEVKQADAEIARAQHTLDQFEQTMLANPGAQRAVLYSAKMKEMGNPAMKGIMASAVVGASGLAIGLTHAIGQASGIVGVLMMGVGGLVIDRVVENAFRKQIDRAVDAAMDQNHEKLVQQRDGLAQQVETARQRRETTRDHVLQDLAQQVQQAAQTRADEAGTITVDAGSVALGNVRVPRNLSTP